MAVYRESPPMWRRRLPLIAVLVVVVMVVIVIIVIIQSATAAPGPNPKIVALESAMDKIGNNLELFNTEYLKIANGMDKAQTGAPGALQNAIDALNTVKADFQQADSNLTQGLQQNLAALQTALNATPPNSTTVTVTVVKAKQKLLSLRFIVEGTRIITATEAQ